MTNGTSIHIGNQLPPPLRTAPDMPPHWVDVELSFDQAAERIIAAHAAEGDAADLPITDLKTWAVAAREARSRRGASEEDSRVGRLAAGFSRSA